MTNCFDLYVGTFASDEAKAIDDEIMGLDLSKEESYVEVDPDNPSSPIRSNHANFIYQ